MTCVKVWVWPRGWTRSCSRRARVESSGVCICSGKVRLRIVSTGHVELRPNALASPIPLSRHSSYARVAPVFPCKFRIVRFVATRPGAHEPPSTGVGACHFSAEDPRLLHEPDRVDKHVSSHAAAGGGRGGRRRGSSAARDEGKQPLASPYNCHACTGESSNSTLCWDGVEAGDCYLPRASHRYNVHRPPTCALPPSAMPGRHASPRRTYPLTLQY